MTILGSRHQTVLSLALLLTASLGSLKTSQAESFFEACAGVESTSNGWIVMDEQAIAACGGGEVPDSPAPEDTLNYIPKRYPPLCTDACNQNITRIIAKTKAAKCVFAEKYPIEKLVSYIQDVFCVPSTKSSDLCLVELAKKTQALGANPSDRAQAPVLCTDCFKTVYQRATGVLPPGVTTILFGKDASSVTMKAEFDSGPNQFSRVKRICGDDYSSTFTTAPPPTTPPPGTASSDKKGPSSSADSSSSNAADTPSSSANGKVVDISMTMLTTLAAALYAL